MLKKIGFFALVTLFVVGCSSEEDEQKERNFKDSVYAFINSKSDVVGFGRMDVGKVMKESNLEQRSFFQMVAATTFNDLKQQVDVNTPVYLAATTTEGHSDLTVYAMLKVKNKEKFIEEWTNMGYVFKESNGISYAEDNEKIMALNSKVLMVIMAPGKFDGKELATKAFKSTKGKIAPDAMKKQIDAKGDVVMHLNAHSLKASDAKFAILPERTEVDMTLNFDNGKMALEIVPTNFKELASQFGLQKSKEPMVAKKIIDEEGNTLMAMQLSAESSLMKLLNIDLSKMESSMDEAAAQLAFVNQSVLLTDIAKDEVVKMPESGAKLGDEYAQMYIDFNAVSSVAPEEFRDYMSVLDYAFYEWNDKSIRLVIATNKGQENFLATIFGTVDNFMNSGGLMQLMAMQ